MGWGRLRMRGALLVALLWAASAPAADATSLADFRAPAVASAISEITRSVILKQAQPQHPFHALPGPLRSPAGVFVTISRRGVTRGCWGTVSPQQAHVAAELAAVARRVRVADWRSRPIHPGEWASLTAHVSIVGSLQPVAGLGQWSPRQFGMWLTSPGRGGVVLPGEGATVAWQVAECRRKAGLSAQASARLYRFETAVVGPISLAP